METSNNLTSLQQQQKQQQQVVSNSSLAPPMSLPTSLSKNINLIKPPNLLGTLPQPPVDLLNNLPPNRLLTQALAKPPSLNLVLNKSVSPSPTHHLTSQSNASTPSSTLSTNTTNILQMPKNVLSNGVSSSETNSPLIGSNLIAQTVKSAELSNISTTTPPPMQMSNFTASLSSNNNNSNTNSLNNSTADLTQLNNNNVMNTNNQFNLANSMPTNKASQFFSSLPTPSSLKHNDPQQYNSPLFQQQQQQQQHQNSTTKLSQSLNHLQSNDLYNSNNNLQQKQQESNVPVSQHTTTTLQQQPSTQHYQPSVESLEKTTFNITPSQPSPVNYFQQQQQPIQSVSSPPTADPFKNIINKIDEQPATAPVYSTPFFQSQQNNYNLTAAPVHATNDLLNLTHSINQQSTNYFSNAQQMKPANYFQPPKSNQIHPTVDNQQQFQPLKPLNQQATPFLPNPAPTPPLASPPIQQQMFYPQTQPPVQNGPSYFNNNNTNVSYQLPPPPPPSSQQQNMSQLPKQDPTSLNYLNNPSSQMIQSSAPPPPLPSTTASPYYSTNNKANYNIATSSNQPPPPPTASDIQQQQQQQHQLTNQLSQMSLSTASSSSNTNYQQSTTASRQSNYPNSNKQQNYFINRSQPQSIDLLREKRLISEYPDSDEIIRPQFPHEFYTMVNCHYDTIRCTLTSIPESQSLLSKCRLPLGILIHPFKDLESLKVVQSSTIVRCRNCRSYINPFVHFLDNSKWRCNMCYSINDLPDEFLFDPVTRSYGDPSKRPEINSSTIEFIAPAEYTLRPPPPAMYLYLLDVSHNAVVTGYLTSFCETLLENLDKIPGDSRTQIGFITYNSSLHFYNLSGSLTQPRMMVYPDLDELVLPLPDNLMINLNENRSAIQTFLQALPSMFAETFETDSALGTALSAGFQLLKHTGGRITIMQTCLPNLGIGSLKTREENIDKDSTNLGPQTDFYKKMALDCAGVHIAVDLFMFNSLYADLATLSCVSKYSGGEIKYYPGYHAENHPEQVIRFCVDFKRYLIRKIGFEAVMRIRCTRGLAIHTFHGNFFVRSTDLLALPNVNPDAGFGMQVAIEENLTDITTVCFQAAVLYTSSKGERRIRIHTYCLPISKNLNELINGADQEAIIGLVAKMAVDRTSMSSLKEAKDALMNVAVDYLQAYSQLVVSSHRQSSLLSPVSLRLIPTYILALIKNIAFKFGSNIRMDDRVYAMNLHKTMPLKYLMLCIYPHLYAIHNLDDRKVIVDSSETEICIPPRLHLSSENIDRHGVYIMDAGEAIYMWIGRSVSDQFLQMVFDVKSFQELPDHSNDLPELDNILSERVRNFLVYLYDSRPFGPTFIYFREDSSKSKLFFQHMHDDKTESSISYYEFLRHLSEQISN